MAAELQLGLLLLLPLVAALPAHFASRHRHGMGNAISLVAIATSLVLSLALLYRGGEFNCWLID